MTADETMKAVAAASAGLLYPGESDEPFTAVKWDKIPGETAAAAAAKHAVPSRLTGEQSAEKFFAELADTDRADRFAALHQLMRRSLAGLVVVRFGTVSVDVFLLGSAGNFWVGLRTRSVET